MRTLLIAIASVVFFSSAAFASPANPWDVRFGETAGAAAPALKFLPVFDAEAAQGSPRTKAVDYGPGYNARRRVHRIASFATIPLFATEYVIGSKLYDGDGSGSLRSAHSTVAAGIAALFTVNTVTGAWNLWSTRRDPEHRTRRWLHGILMLAADAGFVATASMAPDDDDDGEGRGGDGSRSAHRNMAIVSFGTAAVSYVMMLLR
jgi:hypothetical protein